MKGFGFLELLLVMAVCTQQGATALDNALMCKVVANMLLKWSTSQKKSTHTTLGRQLALIHYGGPQNKTKKSLHGKLKYGDFH